VVIGRDRQRNPAPRPLIENAVSIDPTSLNVLNVVENDEDVAVGDQLKVP
jgi:hypothetical protein